MNSDYMMLYQFRDHMPYELVGFIILTLFTLALAYGLWQLAVKLIKFLRRYW